MPRRGRLLRLLAIAGDSSLATRRNLAPEWSEVLARPADFGPVLDPMVAESDGAENSKPIQRLTSQLASSLERPGKHSHPQGFDGLEHWVLTLAREGRQRISELRGADS